MISVFGAFVLGDDPIGKLFGVGLAVAVFLDATLVRMVLVPATMSLLGRGQLVAARLARPDPAPPRPRGRSGHRRARRRRSRARAHGRLISTADPPSAMSDVRPMGAHRSSGISCVCGVSTYRVPAGPDEKTVTQTRSVEDSLAHRIRSYEGRMSTRRDPFIGADEGPALRSLRFKWARAEEGRMGNVTRRGLLRAGAGIVVGTALDGPLNGFVALAEGAPAQPAGSQRARADRRPA